MKLKSCLRRSSHELLRSIAAFWGIEPSARNVIDDRSRLSEYLYPRLQARSNFKQTFERLEVGEKEIVYFLALHGGELPVEEFQRRTGLHEEHKFDETVSKLKGKGFYWRESITDGTHAYDVAALPEPYVRLLELPPYWRGFLGDCLQRLDLAQLKAIARHAAGKPYDGRKKQALVHCVRNLLLDPEVLRDLMDRCDPVEKQLIQNLLEKNGACRWRDLVDGVNQKRGNQEKAECLRRLARRSGLIYLNRQASDPRDQLVIVARDIRRILQDGFRRDERTLSELSRGGEASIGAQASAGLYPTVILDNTQNLPRDLTILLAHFLRYRVKVLNNGGVGRNDLKKLVPLLSHNKTVKYASFLSLFAMSSKLLIPVGESWRVSKKTGEWLKDSRQCYRAMYEFWLTTNEWNEEYVEGDVLHVDQYPQNLINIPELRKVVLQALEKTPSETWVDFGTFSESLLPQIAADIPGRSEGSSTERSNRPVTLILESMIVEPLYWFGLITLGVTDLDIARELGSRPHESPAVAELSDSASSSFTSSDDHLFCFKISSTGRQMFDGRYTDPSRLFSSYEEPGAPYYEESVQFTVQPNLEIVTPPDLNLHRFYQLLTFTDVKKVDIMTTLAITRESLRFGMERGFTGSDILGILKESSRRDVPETVVQLVEECGSRHGEIDMGYAGGYIVAQDRLHVQELRSNSRIQRFIKDVFDERIIMLNRTADLNRIARELQKMGFMPRVASDTLHVTGEGLFHVTLRPEELYELLAVLAFAQSLEEDSGTSLFEDRVRQLIERLGHDAKGELNPDYYVEPLLKAFRKNYERWLTKQKDEEKRRLKKQVNRLLNRAPRQREPVRFKGENPSSEKSGIIRLFKFAIEHEMQVKIHYLRSTGEELDEVIEPESLRGERIYALQMQTDEHHIYRVGRILQAAL